MLHAPDDLLRELTYGLNVLLLEAAPELPSGRQVSATLFRVIETEGLRLGAPALLAAWEALEGPALRAKITAALDLIMEELADQEDPFSAGDILRLLQLEPFWRWQWDPYPDPEGLQGHLFQPLPVDGQGSVLPLAFRAQIVDAVQRAEVALFTLHREQRSLYDTLEDDTVADCLADVVERVHDLGRRLRLPNLPALLHQNAQQSLSLGEALALIQRWKLAPDFDPSPDEDDGEWTVRILERYYRISWLA